MYITLADSVSKFNGQIDSFSGITNRHYRQPERWEEVVALVSDRHFLPQPSHHSALGEVLSSYMTGQKYKDKNEFRPGYLICVYSEEECVGQSLLYP